MRLLVPMCLLTVLPAVDGRCETLTFDSIPAPGKYRVSYEEAGMTITTRECPEYPRLAAEGESRTFERHCHIYFRGTPGSGAIRVDEAATSYYKFSLDGKPFDLVGVDILELSGAGEFIAPTGERAAFSAFNPAYSRFRIEKAPRPYRYAFSGKAWKGITWFMVKDAGGAATFDNLEFMPAVGSKAMGGQ